MDIPHFTLRTLAPADADRVAEFLEPILFEIPLFAWLAGNAADDEWRRWIVDLQLVEAIAGGHVHAAEADGELVGLAIWTPPGWVSAGLPDDFRDRAVELLGTRPDALARLAEMNRITADHELASGDACVHLAALAPGRRGARVLEALVAPAFDAAHTAGVGVSTMTSVPAFTAHLAARFDAQQVDEFMVADSPVWIYRWPGGELLTLSKDLR